MTDSSDSRNSVFPEVAKQTKFVKGHVCGVCQKWFKKSSDLRRHGSVHCKEKLIPCDHCNMMFATKDRLYNHRKYLSLEKSINCDICPKSFKTFAALKTHLLTHTREKSFKCDMCNKTFRSKHGLEYHYASRANLAHHQTFEQFKQFEHLVEKYKFITDDGGENKCSVCNKQFKTARRLQCHSFTHSHEKFECDVCGLKFKQKHYMRIHKRTRHSIDRTFFPCEICKRTFVSKYSVKLHKAAVHGGDKPHKCAICPQAYAKNSLLVKHMLSHNGVKNYASTMCDKKYSTIHNLKYHIRGHTGEKPYECEVCGICFKAREMLKNHSKKCKKIETTVETKESTDSITGLVQVKNEYACSETGTLSLENNTVIKEEKNSGAKTINQEVPNSHSTAKLFCFGGKVVTPQNLTFIKVQSAADLNLLRVTRLFQRYRCLSNVYSK